MRFDRQIPARFLLVAFATLAVLISGSLLAGTAHAGNRPLTTGVTVPDFSLTTQNAYKRIRGTGAKLTRVTINWNQVAPAEKPTSWDPVDPGDPHYHWEHYDGQIGNAVRAGLKPMVQIFAAPRWAERCRGASQPGICNPDPVALARFAKAAARRYNGGTPGRPAIRYWQPWNEPNLVSNFEVKRANAPDLYRAMVNRFAAAVKSVNRANLVVGGGLAPLGGGRSYSPLTFARKLLCMTGRAIPRPIAGCRKSARFDIWATNPYTSGGPTHKSVSPDDVQLGDLGKMTRLIRNAKKAGKIRSARRIIPYWLTEFSWDSKPPDPGGVPMRLLKRWTAQAMFQGWRSGASAFFWFSLRDLSRNPGQPYAETLESGLYQRGASLAADRPKGNLKAFRFPVVAFRKSRGIYVWGKTPGGRSGRVTLRFRPPGKGSRVLTRVRADRYGIFSRLVRTRLGRGRRGSVTASFGRSSAVPFSLKLIRDRYQPPFG